MPSASCLITFDNYNEFQSIVSALNHVQMDRTPSSNFLYGIIDHQAIPTSMLVFLCRFVDEGLVDVWYNTSSSDCSLNQRVKLFVPTDCQLQMSGSNTFDLQIFTCIASKLQHLGSQVLQDSSGVHCGSCADSSISSNSGLQQSVNAAHRELPHEKRQEVQESSQISTDCPPNLSLDYTELP